MCSDPKKKGYKYRQWKWGSLAELLGLLSITGWHGKAFKWCKCFSKLIVGFENRTWMALWSAPFRALSRHILWKGDPGADPGPAGKITFHSNYASERLGIPEDEVTRKMNKWINHISLCFAISMTFYRCGSGNLEPVFEGVNNMMRCLLFWNNNQRINSRCWWTPFDHLPHRLASLISLYSYITLCCNISSKLF